MKLIPTLIATIGSLFLLGANAQDVDPAVREVDDVAVGKIERALKNVRGHHQTYLDILDTQFEKLINDSLQDSLQKPAVYLQPVQRAAQPLLNAFQLDLSDNQVKLVQASFGRQDDAYKERATRLIDERQKIYQQVIAPLQASYQNESDGGEQQMTLAVFQPAADAMVEKLKSGDSLMRQVRIDKDKLEYFLNRESRQIWNDVLEGGDGVHLFSARYKKRMSQIMQDHLVEENYFNAERPLKEALQDYEDDDTYYSLHLLYAFVKLINESNPDAVNEGYTILQEAYESDKRELDRDRDRIAFNYLRVGTRLGRIDEDTFLKLLDHVKFIEDDDALIDLYNLAMARYIKQDMWQEASDLYAKAQEKGLQDQLPDAFIAMVLLKEGNFRELGDQVQIDSVAELLPAND